MRKLIILLFISVVLTSCSSKEAAPATTEFSSVKCEQDISIDVTDSALEKMNYEIKNSKINGAVYRINFVYSSAGWGSPIYNVVLDEQEGTAGEWKYYEKGDIVIAVPVSLIGYLNGIKIDYDGKSVVGDFLIEPIYWQTHDGVVKLLTSFSD